MNFTTFSVNFLFALAFSGSLKSESKYLSKSFTNKQILIENNSIVFHLYTHMEFQVQVNHYLRISLKHILHS